MSRFTTASRRQFLLGGAALGATGFLAACGGGNGGTGAGPTDGGGNEPSGWDWPAYQAFTGPQPDLPGTQDGVNAGFLAYPALADLVDTVSEAPGDGQPVTAMTPNYNRQPLDMDRNPFWQGLNERLGSVLDVRMVPGADYSNVFATTVASGEMPDLFTLYASPRLPEFLQSQALDLTDHLAGDAILAYPNLAAIPTSAWQYSVFGGRIYTIPLFRGLRTSWALIQRSDLMEQMGLNPEPQSFEELLEVAKEFTDPSQNRWAFSDFPADFLRQTLGIPNGWGLEGDTITSALTDERQMDFFEAGLRLMEAGVVHPEAFDDSGRKSRLSEGQALFAQDGLGGWNAFYSTATNNFPEIAETFDIDGTKMFDFADGYTGRPWRAADVLEQCVVGASAESRIEAVLGVANWLAAPIGSTEKLYQTYGVEGEQFEMVDGAPKRTEAGGDQWLNLQLLVSAPFAVEDALHPHAVERLHAFQTYLAENAIRSAADGLYSETLVSDGGVAETTFKDLTNDIVQGRRSVDEWTREVDDFMLSTGQQIIDELTQAREEAADA
ncbi:type 2 periplasmic-binding domain-containing protein [Actinotalea caeni]|uniref:extracellular solute-binding protein n=1 Tax=Actinotalea caeni TaxID=1348467 RepID=UPI0012E19C9D|nr:extracellular solute-binding protein [Actinotalea caeni]